MNCKDGSVRRPNRPEIVLCERLAVTPNTLIGQPTHRPTIQASLTTGVASYHSSVVKVRRAGFLPAPERRQTLPHLISPRQGRRKTDAVITPLHRPRGVPLYLLTLFGFAHACWAKRHCWIIICIWSGVSTPISKRVI